MKLSLPISASWWFFFLCPQSWSILTCFSGMPSIFCFYQHLSVLMLTKPNKYSASPRPVRCWPWPCWTVSCQLTVRISGCCIFATVATCGRWWRAWGRMMWRYRACSHHSHLSSNHSTSLKARWWGDSFQYLVSKIEHSSLNEWKIVKLQACLRV